MENKYKKEKKINNNNIDLKYQDLKIISEQMESCVCKIERGSSKGTGFFSELRYGKDKDRIIKTLITCYHVFEGEDLEQEIEIKISFKIHEEKIEKPKTIKLNFQRIIFFDKNLDVIIIEIKNTDRITCKYLEVDGNKDNDEYYNENKNLKELYEKKLVYILHYPQTVDGKYAYSAFGLLNKINDIQINHYCNTESGSSGSPILLLENKKVIGLHRGASTKFNFNNGVLMKGIIDKFEEFLKKNLFNYNKNNPYKNVNSNNQNTKYDKITNDKKNYQNLNPNKINNTNEENIKYNLNINDIIEKKSQANKEIGDNNGKTAHKNNYICYNNNYNIDNKIIKKDNDKNYNNKNNIDSGVCQKYNINDENKKYMSINQNKYKTNHNYWEIYDMNDNKNIHINNNNYMSINNKKYNIKCLSINKNNNFDNTNCITFNNKNNNIGPKTINTNDNIYKLNIYKLLDDCCIPKFEENEYNDLQELGYGSFGKIFLVRDIKTNQEFALKHIFSRDYVDCREKIKKLESLYKLDNDNIIKLYKINIINNHYSTFIINILMEKAEKDWDKEIKERKNNNQIYTESEILVLLKQLTSGLSFLQKKNIAHRDIKPQNILIFPKKNLLFRKNLYKIADLGEAKDLKNKKEHTLIGSELFMSPLLYNGFSQDKRYIKHNVFKSDVYSLGLCFVYAICLNLDVVKIIRKIIHIENLTKIIESNCKGNYSPNLMNIIYKMIEYEENKRYDFEELEKELEKIKYLKYIK